MSDDKTKQGNDRKQISMSEDYEVRYWTDELGVSPDELAAAVKSVGKTRTRSGSTCGAARRRGS